MARPLRIVTPEDLNHVRFAVDKLKEVRDTLKKGGAKRAALYVSSALKSVEGAARHAERAVIEHRLRACTEGKPGERVYAHSQWHEIVERLPNGILLVRTFESAPGYHEPRPRDTLSALDSTIARGYITSWTRRGTGEPCWLVRAWDRNQKTELRELRGTKEKAERALRNFLAKCPA